MAGRKKSNRTINSGPYRPTRPDQITVAQYTKGFEVFSTSGSVADVLAVTDMTHKQFEYLLTNPLPGYDPDDYPSYYARFAEISTEMRSNAVEAAKIVNKGAIRNVRSRDRLATMAEIMANLLFENRVRELTANAKLDPGDPNWKANHKMTFTHSENQMLRQLHRYMDYSKVSDTFTRVYDGGGEITGMPKGTKINLDVDPESVLPANISTRALLGDAQEQAEDDFHQQLFRDFDAMSIEDLEQYLQTGELPESEKRRRNNDDGPEEM